MKNVNGKVNALAMAIIAGGTAIATGAPAVAQGIDFGIWGNNGGSSRDNLSADSVNWFSTSATTDSKGNTTSAWNNFRKFSGLDAGWLDQELKELPGFNQTTCENSKTIWYTVINDKGKGGYFWVNSISGQDKRTILVNGSGDIDSKAAHAAIGVNGTIRNPALTYGISPTQAQADALVKKYGKDKLEDQAWTLVCSGSLMDETPDADSWIEYKAKDPKEVTSSSDPNKDYTPFNDAYTRNRDEAFKNKRDEQREWKEPVNVSLSATPGISKEEDPGTILLSAQNEDHRTKFGDFYKKVKDGEFEDKSLSDAENEYNAAMDVDNKQKYELKLSDSNKNALAEGGIMNFSQFNQIGTITARETETFIEKRSCNRTYEFIENKWTEKVSCGEWGKEILESGFSINEKSTTQQSVGFWQMLVVHCNPEGFNKVKNALGSDVSSAELIDQGNGKAGVIKTVVYDNADGARLGIKSEEPDLSETAYKRFYDKECGLQCYAPPTSRANGGDDKKVQPSELPKYSPSKDGGTGVKVSDDAKFDGKNLTIFRDNNPNRTITINVWKPEISANAVAKTTTLFRDPEGTPGAEGSAGEFVMTDKNGKNVFDQTDTEGKNIEEQKGWNVAAFNSKNVSVLNGAQNVFNVRANWPSEVGKPQVLNAAWEYDVTGKATIPGTVGIQEGSKTPVTKNLQEQKANIEGRCFAMFNSNEEDLGSTYLNANTGSGTDKAFNNAFAYKETTGADGKKTTMYNDPYNIVIDFVRTSAE